MYLLESPHRGDSNKYKKTYVFLKNNTGLSMKKKKKKKKKKLSADFCADGIGVITNYTVITNVVIKRVDCI